MQPIGITYEEGTNWGCGSINKGMPKISSRLPEAK